MKLAKYIAISVIAVLITISILIRVPQVQDRLIEGLAEDAINNPTIPVSYTHLTLPTNREV